MREARASLADPIRRSIYLVSSAGAPNFGDEFLTRAWLDWLAEHHPRADVWLDCIHPGRATHLFGDTHPRLRVTNTLWQLAHTDRAGSVVEDAARARRLVTRLASPQFDLGLEALRGMTSIHLLGGGYLNSVWPANLAMTAAVAEVSRAYGVPAFATGQGLLPQTEETRAALAADFAEFEYVEARDAGGAEAFGATAGIDDAFLAFATRRRIYGEYETPQRMILVQGDFIPDDRRQEVVARLADSVNKAGCDVGFVEAYPPFDAELVPGAEMLDAPAAFFPFMRIWQEGFPARPDQSWFTSRFHLHLLAAAAGAQGTAIAADRGYYDVKHESLRAVGTGWSYASLQDWLESSAPDPTRNTAFSSEIVPRLAERKASVATRLYG